MRPVPASLLVHLTHGPEHPTRAALGFAVASAALDQGHDVSIFLAGDAVQLLRPAVREHLSGLGTGPLGARYDAFVAGGGRIYASGGSSAARGVADDEIGGAALAGPPDLARLVMEHDRVLTY
jgi:uncharacterized protein